MEITKTSGYDALLSNEAEKTYTQCTEAGNDVFLQPGIEDRLLDKHAQIITENEKEVDDYPNRICCSCECLYQKKSVTKVKLSDSLGDEVWPRLKDYLHDQNLANGQLYMCNYCKSKMKNNKMPPRCIFNGLTTVPIPPELSKLDALSSQLIQKAKCYQTVVRLGTYTAKVPVYNSLKACKGTMFFLPLPLKKTFETLDQVKMTTKGEEALPDPELYIIVNGKPKVVWCSLVNVNNVKTAVRKLKEINWLYSEVDDESVDDASKQVIEVVNSATSTMLDKADDSDIAGFQAFTIRNLENKLSTDLFIEQYKLMNVKEDPIDNRQQHLDAMCFPVQFPDGRFGKYHPRKVKISHSEYDKQRLLNKDSRFRKDPQYVFYLLWQKEMRELSAGVYNLLKQSRASQRMTVGSLLSNVQRNDEHLEANLCTMLQSVRGTKQYWFLRKSELRCIIREWGSPTLFLTFSCSEYESPDIINYLRQVNDLPPSYNAGKLCTEDPVSVSRQFSIKFHAFFQTVLKKGEVLGTVDHFYWKKEYQARGAPHYHALLWIKDAPVIDKDDPDDMLKWIQERITCHIPDKKSDPELHNLVTRYQMHKCSSYCKRKRKVGSVYITRCRFNFPRHPCETAKLNSVSESLKSRNRIYELAGTESEIRVNDYNPLLLMLWKANIDVQFVSESSLALAHYVSGYVTKAEKSSMQEIWDQVSESKSVYSRLWSFGVRSLRSRQCGLYEASDLLLGDHLTEKSDTVKWVDVSMPHKRKRRLKDHKQLEELARSDPDTDDIYEESLLETHYPQRPDRLADVCLYDFVTKYDWQTKDKNGERKYSLLSKPRLLNHRLYDPQKENQREDYFYSLIFLFVPFTSESSLLLDNETAEAAFSRLMTDDSSAYHKKQQKMLEAQSKIKDITEARQADGDEQRVSNEDNDPQLMGEAKNAMHDMFDMMANQSSDPLSLEEREAMLNVDQRRIYDNLHTHLQHQKRHEVGECLCDFKPLSMFVSGVGGTGKSFLIEALKCLVGRVWTDEGVKVVVAAPTGLAAFNVGGLTIQRLFQLPIEHEGKTAEYWSLSKESQKVMKTKLRDVKLIIVDEISMVSSLNLAYMHLRLEELFGGDDWFGCRNVMFVGDIL